jgi:hypothetical protein
MKHYAMKAYGGVDLGTSWSWREVVSFTLWPLYPRERARATVPIV